MEDAKTEAAGVAEAVLGGSLRLLTRTELAERLGVSSRTVDRMLADGEITPVILRASLVRFYLPDVVRQLMARALVSKRGCARRTSDEADNENTSPGPAASRARVRMGAPSYGTAPRNEVPNAETGLRQ